MSNPPEVPANTVVPAHLDYFAIYNPSLGTTDENEHDQLVYYYSHEVKRGGARNKDGQPDKAQRNEQLRQIGLAQGMVEFGGNFSSGAAVEMVELEKSRLLLHQLESGWWLMAVGRACNTWESKRTDDEI